MVVAERLYEGADGGGSVTAWGWRGRQLLSAITVCIFWAVRRTLQESIWRLRTAGWYSGIALFRYPRPVQRWTRSNIPTRRSHRASVWQEAPSIALGMFRGEGLWRGNPTDSAVRHRAGQLPYAVRRSFSQLISRRQFTIRSRGGLKQWRTCLQS